MKDLFGEFIYELHIINTLVSEVGGIEVESEIRMIVNCL